MLSPCCPLEFSYHDHLLTGVPGFGNQGTAGEFKAPWKIIIVVYNPDVALSPDFKPITSADDLDAAEANGEFLPINPGADNPFEINTGSVLICPLRLASRLTELVQYLCATVTADSKELGFMEPQLRNRCTIRVEGR